MSGGRRRSRDHLLHFHLFQPLRSQDRSGFPLASASVARIQRRFLRCGAPAWEADSTRHSASYPSSARSRRITPKYRPESIDNSPGTFSPKNHLGLTMRRTSAVAGHIFLVSSSPSLFPATEKGWHGSGEPGSDNIYCATRFPFAPPCNWPVVLVPLVMTLFA